MCSDKFFTCPRRESFNLPRTIRHTQPRFVVGCQPEDFLWLDCRGNEKYEQLPTPTTYSMDVYVGTIPRFVQSFSLSYVVVTGSEHPSARSILSQRATTAIHVS